MVRVSVPWRSERNAKTQQSGIHPGQQTMLSSVFDDSHGL